MKGKNKAEGWYCKNHECETKECLFRSWVGDWCPEHQCAKPGCAKEGKDGHYCERHLVCIVVGCDRFRLLDGDNVRDRCEERKDYLPPFPSAHLPGPSLRSRCQQPASQRLRC